MNRTLKTLLLWLLMAVLPLNAVAAAMGMSCSAVHDRARQAASVDAVERQASDHSAHHAAGHEATAAQPDVAPDTGDLTDSFDPLEHQIPAGHREVAVLGAPPARSVDAAVPWISHHPRWRLRVSLPLRSGA